MTKPAHGDRTTVRALRCDLVAGGRSWGFAARHAAGIEAHWDKRRVENPGFFNGVIHLLADFRLEAGRFEGELLRTDFKSYLYWRDTGFPEAGVWDAFGSALIRSAEGYVLLGRQREGNINSGLAYLPGGFIDGRDVDGRGRVDIVASVLREVAEETGLAAEELSISPGYLVTFAGPLISIAVELVSPLEAGPLRERMRAHFAGDPQSELTDVVVIQGPEDGRAAAMPEFTRILLDHVFLAAAPR